MVSASSRTVIGKNFFPQVMTVIPTGATTDIQVEAMIGHIGRNNTMIPYPFPYVFFGETSGWSNTQTVTLPPKTAFTASPSPSPTVPRVRLVDNSVADYSYGRSSWVFGLPKKHKKIVSQETLTQVSQDSFTRSLLFG